MEPKKWKMTWLVKGQPSQAYFDSLEEAEWLKNDLSHWTNITNLKVAAYMDVHEFHEKLEQISKANEDRFKVSCTYSLLKKEWSLTVESKKMHELFTAIGSTPEEACANAWEWLPEHLRVWKYVFPFEQGTTT